jgi:hypothetical protein
MQSGTDGIDETRAVPKVAVPPAALLAPALVETTLQTTRVIR